MAFFMKFVYHEFPPVYNSESKVLILGTMPSVKSRQLGFYYAHPQNRFWKILFDLFEEEYSNDVEIKKQLLYQHHIALWDVLSSCEIENSSDVSIKNPTVHDMNYIIQQSNIKTIFTTGKKATELYMRYCYPDTKIPCIYLPSPSPANCSTIYEDLKKEYQKILDYI